ncbi:MAG: hypothetical protein HFI37_06780 [Lachnospiraceae bacterium]|nr:hypothetical protein [Lachnospiraceae bacterium]
MKKQIFVILGLFIVSAVLIFVAASYGEKSQFEYLEHLKDTLFTLDEKEYSLGEISYYIVREEYRIEEQAKIYDAHDTNKYWAIHTNGEFVRLNGKNSALDAAVHDMLLYSEAEKKGIKLDKEEEQYAKNSASDLCYDLSEEQKERAGLTDEIIYDLTKRAALAEKYQGILAKKNKRNFGAYDYNGTAYEKMLEKHELFIEEKLWENIPFGNVAFNHRFEE